MSLIIPKALNYIGDKISLADINGDGVIEIIILNNQLKTIEIYNNLLSLMLTIQLNESISGSSLCTGDFNGDAIDDIIIIQNKKEEIGKAILYFGSKRLEDIKQDILIEGSGGYFGYSCANIGDINKDGYQDFAVGAYTAGSERQGLINIYFGDPKLDNKQNVQLMGIQSESSFGYTVTGIGDLNNDGFDDILVGAPTGGKIRAGQVFIYLGGSPMDTKPAFVLEGENTDDFYGGVIASCKNKDWPTKSEFIIGAYENDDTGVSSGKVYAFEGKWPFSTKPLNIWKGEAVGDCFGYSLEASYNSYGDKKWNWIVSAPFSDEGPNNEGKIYILPLGEPSDVNAEKYIEIPKSLQLMQNYPNPFNSSTTIQFGMPENGNISIEVYNILGERIKIVENNKFYKAGFHKINWNGLNENQNTVSSGNYFIQLKYMNERKTIKVTILK